MLLVVGHHAAPEAIIDHTLPARRRLFQAEIRNGSGLGQIIKRHVDQRSVPARGRCARRCPEAFPLGAARLIDVYVRIDQTGKNVLVANIDNISAFSHAIKRPNADDPAISNFERRSFDAARKNNLP